MECPGCGSYSSDVAWAFNRADPCPICGLSHGTAAEIVNVRDTVRVSRANDEAKAIADNALRRAGKALAEAERLRRQVAAIRAVLDGDPYEGP
jgi:hypothetical protein